MSAVGLVLGGGGITGAAFHFGTLFALQMATGWEPASADVIVGTSSGAVVGAVLRNGELTLDALIGDADGDDELAEALRERIYRRTRPRGLLRWLRHGLLPGLRRPGVALALGSPAAYTTEGIVEWLEYQLGERAHTWPERPLIVAAYDLESRGRIAFGANGAPDVSLAKAVAASSAVPVVFEPVDIDGGHYVDGGVASGTNADLILGYPGPLDLVVVIAPMASMDEREDARFYEGMIDRLGAAALAEELGAIRESRPGIDVLVLRPDEAVLETTRPNPLSSRAAVPAFVTTLEAMQTELARPGVWPILERHLLVAGHR
jgi:NTE family protein